MDTEKKSNREREGEIEREKERRGMAEKFLERRKEPGKMNSVSLRQRRKEKERKRMNKRAGLPGTGSCGIMIILGVGKE